LWSRREVPFGTVKNFRKFRKVLLQIQPQIKKFLNNKKTMTTPLDQGVDTWQMI